MFDIDGFLSLIEEKNRLCREYETCSDEMLTCPDEEMADHLKRRSDIARQIDAINIVIDEMQKSGSEAGDPLRKAVRNLGDRDDLPDKYKAVFDMAQAGFACLNRVMNNEPLIAERMKMRKMQLDQKIRSMKNTPNIISYLNTGVPSPENGKRLNDEI